MLIASHLCACRQSCKFYRKGRDTSRRTFTSIQPRKEKRKTEKAETTHERTKKIENPDNSKTKIRSKVRIKNDCGCVHGDG